MCKSIIKWAGGKKQLIKNIKTFLPPKYNHYYEPFIGGGALFFTLDKPGNVISDYNKELINLYLIVKHSTEELIEDLKKHKNTKEYFYKIRSLDRNVIKYEKMSDVEKASRFIYLNKTAFNGLYRVNRKGEYNVPYGKYNNPKWLDEKNLKCCSNLLQSTEIKSGDFENIKPLIKPGDFIYFDPPYDPINNTSFTAYTDIKFNRESQKRLKKMCDYIDGISAYFMVSNSYTKYILDLYDNYHIHTVVANRNINSISAGRGKIKEVLIMNYNTLFETALEF